jgi:hypothetical protein
MLPNRHTERSNPPMSAVVPASTVLVWASSPGRRAPRILAVALLVLAATAAPSSAADWVFRRSYYSHTPPPGVEPRGPVDPRLGYREAFVGAHPKGAIRGGYRWNNITVSNGYSTDRTVIRESFFDANY